MSFAPGDRVVVKKAPFSNEPLVGREGLVIGGGEHGMFVVVLEGSYKFCNYTFMSDEIELVREKVYLAGPMRNIPAFNFPAFLTAAAELREIGYEVVSPAEHDMEKGFDPIEREFDGTEDFTEHGLDLVDSLMWDFEQVMTVDAIVLLPGWGNSRGATAERAVAQSVGTRIGYFVPHANTILWEDEAYRG